ncbi:2Fe-2S iron-sulfur cluster binding domain-containing protein [Ottowia sp. GY511]|uniref:2Fe-2S iron-sulfur cluster-binding protein n=1 Tax=Ottowia flava TaxID=2675430 RepID=A0ABW4KRN5_9BURK|nr:2Fe-2S iron-sulfur cluster-binding protein [Ottowia sp. GY511]TXK28307.1 2Fe-2S iron-sulfur cluster binding domain-containing protein [Ottowia sp. GY511]
MPASLNFGGQSVEPWEGETVLDALLRVGIDAPFSCKSGSCHTCLMQCTEGPVPAAAQHGLSDHLVRMHYLLPCQCHAQGPMHLRAPQPDDLLTACMLCEAAGHDDGVVRLIFEPQPALRYRRGQTLRVVTASGVEPEIVITSDPAVDMVMTGELRLRPGTSLPEGFGPDAEFGWMFEVRGPFDGVPSQGLPMTHTDLALWHELDEGRTVRAVLEDFYPKVYADERLGPFFRGVTIERAIDKQYSFLRLAMTGEKIYFGDRPRNAHHWMIITHELFDFRQSLMVQTLREHGLSEAQIQRWTRFEEYFRPDIVKSTSWPRVEGGVEIYTEGFERETLSAATLCDHCGAEVASGVEVLYHRRLGTVSCPTCAPKVAA